MSTCCECTEEELTSFPPEASVVPSSFQVSPHTSCRCPEYLHSERREQRVQRVDPRAGLGNLETTGCAWRVS